VVESQVGRAMGARQALWFRQVIERSTILAALTAVGLALLVWLPGPLFIDALTTVDAVREAARAYLPWAALYVLCSFVAFQLDGIFIGTTESRPMRNATALALLAFLLAAWALVPPYANHGLWLAFVLFVIARGITLGAYLPALHRRIREVV
jgi:multidrug resistance protein, MATE family